MTTDFNAERPRIQGWLFGFTIVLWVRTVTSPLSITLLLVALVSGGAPQIDFSQVSTWASLLFELGYVVLSIPTLVLFLSRNKSFLYWFMCLEAWSVIHYIVLMVQLPSEPNLINGIVGIVIDLLLVIYTLKSKRMKAHFAR
ncbi:hypothetical protein PU629_03875 [Pullulanibacillus sp. KACC 23026]|uniref:hypothetical protein n=1 Tax=Pullulanibacillus sp. KACC 23026 TaxID=3028315 RepID=UPI0023B01BA6|nr:hypothetical protein [Pullulanibacillus sp. KACC 23026]WEG13516.1 hypothetical protein PU629_03875 [Pullulanibacillus sp. KACC 23026]